MKTTRQLLAGLFLFSTVLLSAQNGSTQSNGMNPYPSKNTITTQAGPGNPSPQDGNGSLGLAYQGSKCGLNYTTATQRLGQRFFPVGVAQPAAFNIAGIPAGAVIEKAFIWADASGNGAPITVTITPPGSPTSFTPMALVGSDADKCWGYQGSHTYRADVTAAVSAAVSVNGAYQLSGFPTGSPNDVDGATLMIIYSDPTATYTGDLVIWDGAIVRIGVPLAVSMNGFSVCPNNPRNARAFVGIGDLQGLGSQLELNGVTGIPANEDWWDYVDVATTVTPGQSTASFGNVVSGDCYNFAVMGLYWQSDCLQCGTFACEAKPDFSFTGCNPIQFFGTNTGVSPVLAWAWQFGDGGTSNLQNPIHNYATAGSYDVCLTIISRDSDGKTCCEQVCRKVEVCAPEPCGIRPFFTWAQDRRNPLTINFTDASTTAGGSVCSYVVDYGDGSPVFTGPTIPPHTYAFAGSYEVCIEVVVCVYDAFGNIIDRCSDKYCEKVEAGLIIIQPLRSGNTTGGASEQPKAMSVFPVPAGNTLNIVIGDADAIVVKIMNAAGQEVSRAVQQGARAWQADVSQLAAGTYFVVAQNAKGEIKKEVFVKE